MGSWLSKSGAHWEKSGPKIHICLVEIEGCLGGPVGEASDLVWAQVMISRFCVFKPHIGLCAGSMEPVWDSLSSVSLSLCPSLAHAVSVSLSKKEEIESQLYMRFSWEREKMKMPKKRKLSSKKFSRD